ncbi:mechanosensitive ion channel family protein [Myceligenerans pegani]|uniref:Mechanosensitive ion channel family protein n=1 Tax=Myceligenerans pegani TaxID=2776917 RepID=A0ABR9MSN2_9MICO|nr:mechanosensitive ion channel family protein [Myceligenerans sp. TRM 65318]MBE1874384.1 mechanosensitive ion channel family protein [Myceligenerans sp. TRM 65318]MBE3016655.1 mechanosensitive ion channel family protein [Myceligenerans sp. TRM 65318]
MPDALQGTSGLLETIAWMAGAVVVAYLLTAALAWLIRRLGRRSEIARQIAQRLRNPVRATFLVVAAWIALNLSGHSRADWFPVAQNLVVPAVIVTGAWLVGNLAFVVEERAYARIRVGVHDWRQARKLRTQVMMLRRITVGVLGVLALAGIMMTFDGARTVGTSLLASAGLVSIVAALAAQSSLGNVFAGIQVAFTNRIHVGDVVVVEGEWGRIEDITLAYVVVHIWDDRRLILPCTYFTQQPYENWTRTSSELLGTVEFDLDFRTPLEPLRAELGRIVSGTTLWDGRVQSLQVTDATGGTIRVRACVSARDGDDLWNLRCHVREEIVVWVQREAAGSLPRTRFESEAPGGVLAQVASGASPGAPERDMVD